MSGQELGYLKMAKITGEVGVDYFRHAVLDLFGKSPYLGDTIAKFIWDNSEEIQRRQRNWKETMMGQYAVTTGRIR